MTDWIFKILREPEWRQAEQSTEFPGSPADQLDGFIHFSTFAQLEGTVNKHFSDVDCCRLLVFDGASFAEEAMKWEPSRGGQLFPHLYAPLDVSLAIRTWKIDRQPSGQFDLSVAHEWMKAND
ncbi:MAG: DUF952 domain-containing protein [Kordiimonadaceae bacterium]|nr:DUF952 domain-containing protein [Kordiimonadaceae bacterium]MBO6568403.1 DUF952 domain-containing protein [Kordiimonadaceae bacterium]MBO6963868.1 DUF952 domain-containing protein [Kordiimonadaceae bacterium]